MPQANWNNLNGANGTNNTIVADSGGAPVPTTVSVVWDSNGTWASTGVGEENNKFPAGANRILMTGYLDTGAATTSHVTITNIPVELTSTGYDVYAYLLGGIPNKGGGYRILDAASKAVIKDYVLANASSNATYFVEVPQNLAAGVHGVGDYIVFRGLTASGITIEATTVAPYGTAAAGVGDPRAPLNAVQLVPAAAPVTDTIPSGLVAYWNFDGDLLDSIKDFDGTARGTNPVAFVDGKAGFGKSIKLDGTDQFVEITGGNENELEFPGGSMSIAGWFKVDAFDTEWQALIAKGEGSNYRVARRDPTEHHRLRGWGGARVPMTFQPLMMANGITSWRSATPPVPRLAPHSISMESSTGSIATKPVLTANTNHLYHRRKSGSAQPRVGGRNR